MLDNMISSVCFSWMLFYFIFPSVGLWWAKAPREPSTGTLCFCFGLRQRLLPAGLAGAWGGKLASGKLLSSCRLLKIGLMCQGVLAFSAVPSSVAVNSQPRQAHGADTSISCGAPGAGVGPCGCTSPGPEPAALRAWCPCSVSLLRDVWNTAALPSATAWRRAAPRAAGVVRSALSETPRRERAAVCG